MSAGMKRKIYDDGRAYNSTTVVNGALNIFLPHITKVLSASSAKILLQL